MHTSQHLLSAVIESCLELPTLSWSMTAYPTPSYVEIPRAMTAEEIASVQAECNRFVFEGRQVHVEVEELNSIPEVAKTETGRIVGKGLPTDYTGGVKRIVVIEGVDRNPCVARFTAWISHNDSLLRCCGTHLPSLNNLQLFLLPRTEGLSRSATTSARLYFLAGPRLITHLTSTHSLLAAASQTLSCGAPLVPDRVQQVVDDRRKATKRVEDLESELASSIARGILVTSSGQSHVVQHIHRTDDSSNPAGFLSSISSAFTTAVAADASGISPSYILILSSSPSAQTAAGPTVVLVCGNDEAKVKKAGDALKTKLSVKGGGKGTRWSGKFTGVWRDHREGAVVEEVLAEVKDDAIA